MTYTQIGALPRSACSHTTPRAGCLHCAHAAFLRAEQAAYASNRGTIRTDIMPRKYVATARAYGRDLGRCPVCHEVAVERRVVEAPRDPTVVSICLACKHAQL
jgi:hypothetical protein